MRAPDLHRTTTCTCFIDLPPELLTAICSFVECRTVVRCRSVCKRLREIIDASLELQYRIELVQDGMIDGRSQASSQTRGELTTGDRLARLRQLRHAWKTLGWTRCVTVPMPGPCCAYELVGGIFCKTQPGRGRASVAGGLGIGLGLGLGVAMGLGGLGGFGLGGWNDGAEAGDGDEANHVLGSRSMYATWLPGRVDDDSDPGRTVVRDDLGIPTRDFAMDPSQDLMVLFKGGEDVGMPVMVAAFPGVLELHVRTISTNQAHPEAREPVLCTQVLYPITSVFIQIVDDVVGMMYCVDPSRPRITIWNWKTGHLVVDRGDGHLPSGTWDFSFINSRALFVTTGNSGGSLELFTFTCDRAKADSNSSPPSHDTPTSTLIHVATLYLPSVHPSVRLLSVGTHTGPFLATCPPDKLFVASNEERIHVVTIQYVHLPTLDGPRTRPRVCIFTHNRVLQAYLKRGLEQGAAMGAGAIAMPWSEWGPTRARMLPYVGIFQWLRYVHGQRAVLLLPTPETGKSTLQVLDFNVRDAHNAPGGDHDAPDADLSRRKATQDVIDYPTRIVMPNIFVDVVESRLPYREVLRDVRGDYSGVMIDDERLVGLKYPAFLTEDMKEIDVFTM